ncbi:FAD-dependent oxidoreductase [Nocardia sp. NPDC004860]|uniref:FAD-dependent oxidoreductase n=1 Tax=Nocardia sp. NPDC004860 TaxID=3154557 RepID=UPI0033B0EF5B
MSYVVTQPCCNDASCVEVCPVDCIRPRPDDPEYRTSEMLYIDPQTCIDCGACKDACPVDAIFYEDELPEKYDRYTAINAGYFQRHPLDSTGMPFIPLASLKVPRDEVPVRVAVVGSGPAGVYAAEELLTQGSNGAIEVEMFDRLPTPWGLVRAGVAPDHFGTKIVTDMFRRTSTKTAFGFHLNVGVGEHISHDELLEYHHAVIYTVGAMSDRKLGIPGESLPGSVAATEFVAWYNGHPDYTDRHFDLSGERAVVVGNGNVALDVARILVTDPDQLARTDIAEHALAALLHSRIREVVVLGRRGPAQAAYTSPELLALQRIPGVDVVIEEGELDLDANSRAAVDGIDGPYSMHLKTRVAEEISAQCPHPASKRIVLRYLTSPTRILGGGRVEGLEIVRNELYQGGDGTLKARATDYREIIDTTLVLRSIGYRGKPVPGMPFDDERGVLPNIDGRVIDPRSGQPLPGVYTAGWIKRGPSGVIGTNKKCAQETVRSFFTDLLAGRLTRPKPGNDRQALRALIGERRPEAVDLRGWQAIDAAERARGREQCRPRSKFTDIGTMLEIAHEAMYSSD